MNESALKSWLDMYVEAWENQSYLQELSEAHGRRTVPVLRIFAADGEERWMPESADIVRYLDATYGQAAA